jgi:uncharacterized protein YbjT (DUF2867 family)
MTAPDTPKKILLTGATGFVGGHLRVALEAAGHDVSCGTRDPEASRREHPDRRWVEVDVEQPHTLEPALDGCDAAYYLVHHISGDDGYAEREVASAQDFRAAAERAGVERIVYLGGVEPAGTPSRHLQARLDTGRTLREGEVPTAELRAAMILGAGGASWEMVHDLAKRLPAMLLPRWLRNRSRPVAIDDVVVGLLAALDLPAGWSGWFDVPGPEILSHRDLLAKVAGHMGYQPPLLDVPVVTPRLSSYWIGLVTDADLDLAKELVEGLTSDLLPTGDVLWPHLADYKPLDVDEAVENALADPRRQEEPSEATARRIRAATERYLAGPRLSLDPATGA